MRNTARTIREFFVTGAATIAGLVPSRLHLFGVDDARVYYWAAMAMAGSIARILYGGQVPPGFVGSGPNHTFPRFGIGAMAGYYGGWRDEF